MKNHYNKLLLILTCIIMVMNPSFIKSEENLNYFDADFKKNFDKKFKDPLENTDKNEINIDLEKELLRNQIKKRKQDEELTKKKEEENRQKKKREQLFDM